jgi:preprotein translocase subunit SecB
MPNKKKDAKVKADKAGASMESGSEMHHHDMNHAGGHMAIGAQYVKDISFENPKAPHSLVAVKEKPTIDLRVDAAAHQVQGDTYEVAIHIVAKAMVKKEAIFLCDLTYGGLFTLHGIADNEREPALLIQGANSLYPFARRIVADMTRDGGFPTLMLDPIDFAQVYVAKNTGAKKAAAKKKA